MYVNVDSKVLHEKLIVAYLSKIFTVLYGT
jgi:hypothetical protein